MDRCNQEFALSLVEMLELDIKVRDELAKSTDFFQGYHPIMEEVHNKNADNLEKIINKIGWPTIEKVGEEASYAAWIILQHAIAKPNFIRKTLVLLERLASENKISKRKVAILRDRINFFEMKPQKYGTQFDYNDKFELVPWMIEDEKNVDLFRQEVGLPPLDETIIKLQKQVNNKERAYLQPLRKRQKARIKWAKKVGWIK